MNDPEVQQIMSDPAMRMILEQMQSDPQAVQVNSIFTYIAFMLMFNYCLGICHENHIRYSTLYYESGI